MPCPRCGKKNDTDVLFCASCGTALVATAQKPARSRRPYLFMLVLVPVVALVVCLGYYKFLLPEGVAAVVNGEDIMRSELDEAVARSKREGGAAGQRTRYETLNMLITERIILQEARKAGMTVSPEELAAAIADARTAVGADEAAFRDIIVPEYGSMQAYENELSRRLLISRFITEIAGSGNVDQKKADIISERRLQNILDRASVRVALAEEVEGPGCAKCSMVPGRKERSTAALSSRCRSSDPRGCSHAAEPR